MDFKGDAAPLFFREYYRWLGTQGRLIFVFSEISGILAVVRQNWFLTDFWLRAFLSR
jgi:hypothetical protein